MAAERTLMTFQEAAVEAGVSTWTVKEWARQKRFSVVVLSPKVKRIDRRVWEAFKTKRTIRGGNYNRRNER